jgi:large subunit ribosomal protein L30e
MADLSSDIRLAVDSGTIAVGLKSVIRSIKKDQAKLVIASSKNNEDNISEVEHLSKVAGIKFVRYESTPVEFGTLCGKPFSVSMISVIDAGNSKILETIKSE